MEEFSSEEYKKLMEAYNIAVDRKRCIEKQKIEHMNRHIEYFKSASQDTVDALLYSTGIQFGKNSTQDRPDLIARLDAAEERIKELEELNSDLSEEIIRAKSEEIIRANKSRYIAENKLFLQELLTNSAESIAKKYDYVCADLEKCRVAMGTIQFEKVINGNL